MVLRARIALAATIASVLSVASPAQLADWMSAPATATTNLQLEQSVGALVDGSVVRAFSFVSRTSQTLTSQFGAPTVVLANDHLTVQDGPMFYGYSSRSATFAAQLAFGGTLINSGQAQTWHSVVRAGNTLYIYLPMLGNWMTATFAATPTVMIGRFGILIYDGAHCYGVSSFYGTLVPLFDNAATPLTATGNVALAQSPGLVHGFSAYKNTWSSMPVAATPTVLAGYSHPGFVAINDGAAYSFFSGHTGSWVSLPASPAASFLLTRQVGIVVDGLDVYAYSGLLGSVATMTAGSTPLVAPNQFLALISDATGMVGYSAALGTFSSVLYGNYTPNVNASVAVATPIGSTTPAAVYSANLGDWVATPPLASPTTYVSSEAVVLVDNATGVYGLSSRNGTWNFLPTPPPTVVTVGSAPTAAAAILVRVGQDLHAFNAKSNAWRSITTVAPVVQTNVHFEAYVVRDATNAYGFSNLTDRWQVKALPAPATASAAQVSSGYVRTANEVEFYCGIGQLSSTGEYPDFWRAITQGCIVRFDVSGEPGAEVLLAVSGVSAEINLGAPGVLYLDPSSLFFLADTTIPGSGVFGLSLPAPSGPGISGLSFYLQAGINGPNGLYLTNVSIATVY